MAVDKQAMTGMNDAIKKAFLDRDGALSIPEIIAAVGSVAGISTAVYSWLAWRSNFDLTGFSVGVSALVAGIAGSQRWRDGPMPPEDKR